MNDRLIKAHMEAAFAYAKVSHCRRLQVGCLIVKDDKVISIGYNGTPPGWDNCCEDVEYTYDVRDTQSDASWSYNPTTKQYSRLRTRPEVLHAEANAIAKLAKTTGEAAGASVFVTTSPCLECAKQLSSIGIKELYYVRSYRNDAGIEFLKRSNIPTYKIDM